MLELTQAIANAAKTSNLIVKDAQKNLSSKGKNSSGRLSRSISSRVEPMTKGVRIKFFMEEYGTSVDMGRDGTNKKQRNTKSLFYTSSNVGRFPPPPAIKKWIKEKPVLPFGSPALSVDSQAYVIGRKIKRDGIRSSMFFTDAYRKHESTLAKNLAQAIAKDITKQITITLKL